MDVAGYLECSIQRFFIYPVWVVSACRVSGASVEISDLGFEVGVRALRAYVCLWRYELVLGSRLVLMP